MVVILAGYEAEVEALMTANPGLKSRFSEKLHFPDFTQEAATKLLLSKVSRDYGLEVEGKAMEQLPSLMEQVHKTGQRGGGCSWGKRPFGGQGGGQGFGGVRLNVTLAC